MTLTRTEVIPPQPPTITLRLRSSNTAAESTTDCNTAESTADCNTALNRRIEQLRKELQAAIKQEAEEAQQRHSAHERDLSSHLKQVETVHHQRVTVLHTQISGVQNDLDATRGRLSESKQKCTDQQAEIETLRQNLAQMQIEVDSLQNQKRGGGVIPHQRIYNRMDTNQKRQVEQFRKGMQEAIIQNALHKGKFFAK